jgi:hypothetical protein
LLTELPKPYREKYESKPVDLIEERTISYLSPTKEWKTDFTK